MQTTTIKVTKDVRNELQTLKKYSETFNGVIERLLDKYEEEMIQNKRINR